MAQLIRLVYASRSTSLPGPQQQGLDPGIARILAKSRKNNAQKQIVGGLFFADACFLQCLEGDDEAIDALYEKIRADRRHRDVKTLSRVPIVQRSFSAWSMKYVPAEKALAELMRTWGKVRFDPYSLSPAQIDAAVVHMQREPDTATTLPADLDDAALPAPRLEEATNIIGNLKPSAGVRRTPSTLPPGRAVAARRLAPGIAWPLAIGVIGSLGALLYWLAR